MLSFSRSNGVDQDPSVRRRSTVLLSVFFVGVRQNPCPSSSFLSTLYSLSFFFFLFIVKKRDKKELRLKKAVKFKVKGVTNFQLLFSDYSKFTQVKNKRTRLTDARALLFPS